MDPTPDITAIAIGVSAGGMQAMAYLLSSLPKRFPVPIIIVQHRTASDDNFFVEYLNRLCPFWVKEAEDKEQLKDNIAYIAPPNYHLLVEKDRTVSLCYDNPINFARPSIDVLFETAAEAFKEKLLGIILTGANMDGSKGIEIIKQFGGTTIAQDPSDAEVPVMPKTAIETGKIDHILTLRGVSAFLCNLFKDDDESHE